MRFYLTLVSSDLRLLRNERLIFSKVARISDFRILSGWIEKYKPALSKSDYSWDNSYCARLAIVSLAVNIGKLQFLVNDLQSIAPCQSLHYNFCFPCSFLSCFVFLLLFFAILFYLIFLLSLS